MRRSDEKQVTLFPWRLLTITLLMLTAVITSAVVGYLIGVNESTQQTKIIQENN